MAYVEYKKLIVWQRSIALVKEIYVLTGTFPREETYGLVSQMRRAAVSIPSNIAEGSRRKGNETKQFFRFAFASGAELETQLEISKEIDLVKKEQCEQVNELLGAVMKMLNVMIMKE